MNCGASARLAGRQSSRLLERGRSDNCPLADRLFESIDFVRFFPSNVRIALSEMSIVSGLGINRSKQIELFDNRCRFETEDFADRALDFFIAHDASPESIHANRNR